MTFLGGGGGGGVEVRAGGCVHGAGVRGESARGGVRGGGARGDRDAGGGAGDELFGDYVPVAADSVGLWGAGADLHAGARDTVRGASHHRDGVGAGDGGAAAAGDQPVQSGGGDRAGGGDARG